MENLESYGDPISGYDSSNPIAFTWWVDIVWTWSCVVWYLIHAADHYNFIKQSKEYAILFFPLLPMIRQGDVSEIVPRFACPHWASHNSHPHAYKHGWFSSPEWSSNHLMDVITDCSQKKFETHEEYEFYIYVQLWWKIIFIL